MVPKETGYVDVKWIHCSQDTTNYRPLWTR